MHYTTTGIFPTWLTTLRLMALVGLNCYFHDACERYRQVNLKYLELHGDVLRRDEIMYIRFPSSFYFAVGSLLVIVLFPLDIARLAILHLSVGDPAAAIIGVLFGSPRVWPTAKSIEGFGGCFIVSTIASLAVFSWHCSGLSDAKLLEKAVFAGFCAAIAEISTVRGSDDNITMPVQSAFFMWCGRLLFGII